MNGLFSRVLIISVIARLVKGSERGKKMKENKKKCKYSNLFLNNFDVS